MGLPISRSATAFAGAAGLALLALALAPGGASAQSLNRDIAWGDQQFLTREYRPFWDERYQNLSTLSYRNFPIRGERPRYDPFGAYLLDGRDLLRVNEYRTLEPDRSSLLSGPSLGQFRNLVIMRDTYRDWSTRFMIGERLNAHLSPLTLNRANFEGLRLDASNHRNKVSLLTTRVSHRPRYSPKSLDFATYLYGGRWETRLGDMVTFGATFANVHHRDTRVRQGDFRGVFPSDFDGTGSYFVLVSDDSPTDHAGVTVYQVQAYVNGAPLDTPPDVRRVPEIARAEDVAHIRQDLAWAPMVMPANNMLKETQPGRGRYYSQGIPVTVGAEPLTVGGTDVLTFRFEVPPETERVEFRVLVAGDYSLDVGAAFPEATGGDKAWADWHNVLRAPGNVSDGSNLKWERLEYGFPTGLAQLGGDLRVTIDNTTIEAEYVRNAANFEFPLVGEHHRQETGAWFAKVLHREGRWSVGGEVFDMPWDYHNSLPMWNPSSQSISGNSPRRNVVTYEMVEDNDDRDEWPDKYEHWDPLDPVYINGKLNDPTRIDSELPQPSVEYGFARDFTYGVFPGLDEDEDGVPDTNVNQNEFADYSEPFLMYYVEPDEFAYGDDFNNNGVIDDRENDNQADFPYEVDTQGYHAFAAFEASERLGIRAGRYDVEQSAADGRNTVTYAELSYIDRRPAWGRINLQYRIKRVRDDIADPVYKEVVDPLASGNRATAIQPDLLLARNSLVSTAFAESVYDRVAGLTVTNATKVEVNRRLDDRSGQGKTITDWTWVTKADYGHRVGNLTITPMVKLLKRQLSGPSDLLAELHTWELFPIVRFDLALTDDTALRFGVQGLPVFEHRYRNRESESSNFNARHYVLVFQTRSQYTGYDLSVNVGVRRSLERLIDTPSEQEREFTQFFVQARVL